MLISRARPRHALRPDRHSNPAQVTMRDAEYCAGVGLDAPRRSRRDEVARTSAPVITSPPCACDLLRPEHGTRPDNPRCLLREPARRRRPRRAARSREALRRRATRNPCKPLAVPRSNRPSEPRNLLARLTATTTFPHTSCAIECSLAKGDHLADAAHGQPRFARSRLVIEAGVENAGIVAALMAADARFLFRVPLHARPGNADRCARQRPDPRCLRRRLRFFLSYNSGASLAVQAPSLATTQAS